MTEPSMSPFTAAFLCFLFMLGAIFVMAQIDKLPIVAELGNGE